MGILAGISLLFGCFTIYFLLRIPRCFRRRQIVRTGTACAGCFVSAAVAGAAAVIALGYLSYERLIDERLVSQIEFRRISPEEYQARLMIDGKDDQFFVLRGNEWQMDARIITWEPPMTILGLDPIFKLERLSGRYADIDREQHEARTVHSLTRTSPFDVWSVARRFPILMPGIDAHYGTATYVPMADGARYTIYLSRDALVARPANERARRTLGDWRRPGE